MPDGAPWPNDAPPVEIWTDGACSGNPGVGGWAALLRFGQAEKLISGSAEQTTNNRMELMAALEALRALKRASRVVLTTDSVYLKDGIVLWLPNWKSRGWKTAAKQPVKNQDLWQALDSLAQNHEIEWRWTKGHAGQAENERVDRQARLEVQQLKRGER